MADWQFENKQIHSGALSDVGNIYSGIMNPTNDVVEQRLAALEGGTAALAVASGSSAITYSILNIAGSGDHIVSSSSIYRGTYNLFKYTLPKLRIHVTLVQDHETGTDGG